MLAGHVDYLPDSGTLLMITFLNSGLNQTTKERVLFLNPSTKGIMLAGHVETPHVPGKEWHHNFLPKTFFDVVVTPVNGESN